MYIYRHGLVDCPLGVSHITLDLDTHSWSGEDDKTISWGFLHNGQLKQIVLIKFFSCMGYIQSS